MNAILAILDAVINALWQAVAVAVLVRLALRFMPRMNAATRYAIWWATLAVVLVLPAGPRLTRMIRIHPQPAAVTATPAPKATVPPVTVEPLIVPIASGRTARWPLTVLAVWSAILALATISNRTKLLLPAGCEAAGHSFHPSLFPRFRDMRTC